MKNFDWSKVTSEQLMDIPAAVLGEGFRLIIGPDILIYDGKEVASFGLRDWWLTHEPFFRDARIAIACIDRIANYLSMQVAK
jgi:hypothetical protein